MNQLAELVRAIQQNPLHRRALEGAESHEALIRVFMEIADSEGLYVEEGIIEAAIRAAELQDDGNA
jgi:hypothetical protein